MKIRNLVFFSGPGSKFSLELKICLYPGVVIAKRTQMHIIYGASPMLFCLMQLHRWRGRKNKLLYVFKFALAHPRSLPVP